MKLNRMVAILLCGALLLSLIGCGADAGPASSETVGEIFTQPPADTSAASTYADLGTPYYGSTGIVPTVEFRDSDYGLFIPYTGGEFHYTFTFECSGNSYDTHGLGFLLFMDGIPQPFHMNEGQEDAYLQVIYPEDGTTDYEFIFTPVAGESNEYVEFTMAIVRSPWYYAEAPKSIQETDCITVAHALFYFEADPPASKSIEVTDRLFSYQVSYEDLTARDISKYSSDELNFITDWTFYADGKEQGICYSCTTDDIINLRFELFGCTALEYSLVFFIDNEPLYIDASKVRVTTQSGKKTIVEVQVDMTDFDGRRVVYAVLVCPNFRQLRATGYNTNKLSMMASSFSVYYVAEDRFS